MAKYDDASWHFAGDFPSDLPKENGGTHIGIFLAWCIHNKLLSEFQLEESSQDVSQVLSRQITGRDFLFSCCDGKLTDEDLNDLGNCFASDYYNDEGKFAQTIASYFQDYSVMSDFYIKEFELHDASIYHVENTWDLYDVFSTLIGDRFLKWKEFRKIE